MSQKNRSEFITIDLLIFIICFYPFFIGDKLGSKNDKGHLAMSANKRRIKSIIIYPEFQLKLISLFIGLFLLSTISIFMATHLFFYNFKEQASKIDLSQPQVFLHFLDTMKIELNLIFIVVAAINLIILFGCGILISHRIAGPIMKIKKFLTNNNFKNQNFSLRKSDFFKELTPVMNQLKNDVTTDEKY